MRDSSLAVEQFDAALLCCVHGSQGMGYEAGNFWALGAAACFGVLLNAISQTRDMKALVNGAYCIVNECITCATDRNLDVGSRQGLGLRRVFNQGGEGVCAGAGRPSFNPFGHGKNIYIALTPSSAPPWSGSVRLM